ncbi:MAG: methyltransferase [Flavobacteriales bacterium]
MANAYFRFKQFTIRQDRCALKVGTDGLLLGSWTKYTLAERILDIGTGTGLLALIAAQRNPNAMIDAVEIDPASAEQAMENVAAGPWPDRINIHRGDIRQWACKDHYDLVLCNPPFYSRYLPSADVRKAVAKHDLSLTITELMEAMDVRCAMNGRISMIIPTDRLAEVIALAASRRFNPSRKCLVYFMANKLPKRVLLEFSRKFDQAEELSELNVQLVPGEFSPEYRALLSDLDLHF